MTEEKITTWFERNKRWIYPAVWFIIGGATGGTTFNYDRIWEYLPSDPSVQVSIDEMNSSFDRLDTEMENLNNSLDRLDTLYQEMDEKVQNIEKEISNASNAEQLNSLKSEIELLKNSDSPNKGFEELSARVEKLEAWHNK